MHVCLILFPGFPGLAAALLQAVLRHANGCAGQPLYTCRLRSVGGQDVTGDDGTILRACAQDWEGAQGFDLVVLCAGAQPLGHLPMGMRGFLGAAAKSGACLAGIGQGAVILGHLGFLEGREAALPASLPDGFLDRHTEITPSAAVFAFDRDRLTARGGLATAEAMLAWISRHNGPTLAARTAQALSIGQVPDLGARLLLADHPDPLMARMLAIMAAHLSDPVSLTRIASELALTPKQLRTRCRKALGQTPAEAYTALRLDRAARLATDTAMSVADIAAACGFASASAFTRSFRVRFGASPRDMRRHQHAQTWQEASVAAAPSQSRRPASPRQAG